VFICTLVFVQSSKAANLLVYTTADSGAGSLRQAIADNRALGGGNTIIMTNTLTGTIRLISGELFISNNVTILGPGANVLAVDGNVTNFMFTISSNTVSISGLTITNGLRGIANLAGTVTVSNCAITGNNTGIYNGNARLSVVACTISGNTAIAGAGIYNDGSALGHAILSVTDSTISGNLASDRGGGIANDGSAQGNATLSVISSTFSGNSPAKGDAIFNEEGSLTVGNTIFAGATGANIVNSFGTVTSLGYNLSSDNGSGFLTGVGDQINTDPLLGPLQDNGGPTLTHLPGTNSPAIDQGKNLSGLATDQRGRCRTYRYPSIPNPPGGDGTDIGAVESTAGQRNLVTTTNDNGGSLRWCLCDAQPGETITFASFVTNTIVLAQGELVLAGKNVTVQGPGAQVLAVSGNGASRVFNVSNSTVDISGLTIRDGLVAGAAGPNLAVGGGIYCDQTAALSLTGCVISNCAAVGGNGLGALFGNGGLAGNGFGGGIFNAGQLSLSNCWVVANQAAGGTGGHGGSTIPGYGGNGGTGKGGGIYTSSPFNVTILPSTLSSNLATFGPAGGGGAGSGTNGSATGAGVCINGGAVSLANSTIASNAVNGAGSGVGGGIQANAGGSALLGCTVAGNNGDSTGGGVSALFGIGVTNTIIAGNTAVFARDVQGGVTSGGYNIVGSLIGSGGWATNDQLNVNPLLGPLQYNGGPTPTMALLPGSPAIDQGRRFALTTDQRGAPRPFDFFSIANAAGGDGSDIGAFELSPPVLAISLSGTNIVLSWSTLGTGFRLQSAAGLAASNQWSSVTNTPLAAGDQLYVTNDANAPRSFYRLINP
jgi:hypothetical protein